MRPTSALATSLLATLAHGACTRGEPPAPAGSPSVAAPEFGTTLAPLAPTASAPRNAPTASATAAAANDPDDALLPQTREMPRAGGARFDAHVADLWSAIVDDAPEKAAPFFFPVGAYVQVKDVANPVADWKHRLLAAYVQDLHALHVRLGQLGQASPTKTDDGGRYRLIGLELPEGRSAARWVEPGEEYNKIGYYRVFGSKLRFEVNGTPYSFDVKSLISWRGEWYVVHLSGIR